MIKFMEKIKVEEITLVVIKDDQGNKFGTMQFEHWWPRTKFYGTGESFVFKFTSNNQVKAFLGTGNNQMYQFMD